MARLSIQQLRQKSKAVRNQIALGVAGVCTAVVFAVWVVIDPAGVTETITEGESVQPFGGLLEQVGEQLASVRAAFSTATSAPETSTPTIIIPDIPREPTGPAVAPATSGSATTSEVAPAVREVQLYVESAGAASTSLAE